MNQIMFSKVTRREVNLPDYAATQRTNTSNCSFEKCAVTAVFLCVDFP